MNNLEARAEVLFNNPLVEDSLNKHNQQAWLKAIEFLGDKHIIAKVNQIEKKGQQ